MSEGREFTLSIGGVDLTDHKEKVEKAIRNLGIAAKAAGETFRGVIDETGTFQEDHRIYFKNGIPYLKFKRHKK